MRQANPTASAMLKACLFAAALLPPVSHAVAGGVSKSACPDAARMRTVESGMDLEQLMQQRQIPGTAGITSRRHPHRSGKRRA